MQNTEVALQIAVGLILKTKVLQKKIKKKINFLFIFFHFYLQKIKQ